MDPALIYLVAGIISATIILVLALSSRPRKRTSKLEGLVSGYGCSDFRFRPFFAVLPSGFEDLWECCLLGQGGWGSAYLCRKGNVKAVFKVPKGFEPIIEESRDPPTARVPREILERIRSEADVVGKLDHPNIIKLLGYSEKAPLLIYEYADYGTLRWQLSKGWKPSQKDILLVGIQLGDALRYLHSRGLIHGDIKPGNVFIKDGVIKLGDFSSITKLLSSTSHSGMSGVALGTIGFRAPEQVYRVLGESAKELGVENRIDVYQLANTLLYMLTGESIDGEDVSDKLVAEKLEGIPHNELKRLIGTGLAVEPEKRPSAEELTKQLYAIYEKISGKSG
jgi:serine/threonine protein kinase